MRLHCSTYRKLSDRVFFYLIVVLFFFFTAFEQICERQLNCSFGQKKIYRWPYSRTRSSSHQYMCLLYICLYVYWQPLLYCVRFCLLSLYTMDCAKFRDRHFRQLNCWSKLQSWKVDLQKRKINFDQNTVSGLCCDLASFTNSPLQIIIDNWPFTQQKLTISNWIHYNLLFVVQNLPYSMDKCWIIFNYSNYCVS